ncbi:hypothetical protein [uncultured Psychrobacter sp.]|uniref:hypothetical protein n=1 Tax=uncultured Psychrobacter sp. TaxID=259303 RepID=UPI00262B296E|nr:hypothetical protein [uncultured Psychrobacter sp.]
MLRGSELNEVIENELKEMVKEGIKKAPISNTALHKRLIAKEHIKGGLSTLSTPERKVLIQKYTTEQLLPLNLNEKEEQLYVNKKTRQALLDTIKGLKERITELEGELNQNTVTLIQIINQVKLKTNLEWDDLLAPYLISELKNQSNLKKI